MASLWMEDELWKTTPSVQDQLTPLQTNVQKLIQMGEVLVGGSMVAQCRDEYCWWVVCQPKWEPISQILNNVSTLVPGQVVPPSPYFQPSALCAARVSWLHNSWGCMQGTS